MNSLGRHILVEYYNCDPEILNDVFKIEESMVAAAKEAEATVINATFHHFSPYGVSGVVVIQESHLAIHTWPERGYAAVDVFSCGSKEAVERAGIHGRREEVAQRLWQIISAVRPGHDDRWDANNHRIVELMEIGEGVSLEAAQQHLDDPQLGELIGIPIATSMHVLTWRWLSEAYPGLAEAEHTFH